jgi:G:T-mismatch repair DNA endonuclease (very short patch repair protein)
MIKKIRDLLREGYSYQDIAAKFDSNRKSISSVIKKLDIKTTFEGEKNKEKRRVEKIKKTCLKKYGYKNIAQVPKYRKKIAETMHDRYGSFFGNILGDSKFQNNIAKILRDNNIEYREEVSEFGRFNKVLNKHYSPRVDFILDSNKIIIECLGDYWHANPSKFKNDDKIFLRREFVDASKVWANDKIRNNHITSFGYKIICIWENDFKKE